MKKEERLKRYLKGCAPLYIEKCYMLASKLSKYWAPYDGYRSFERQDELYAQGRTKKGPIITYAKGGRSFHNYGLASDWAYFKPGQNPWDDAPWHEFHEAIDEVEGLERIGDWDKVHVQLSTAMSLDELERAHKNRGLKSVWAEIEREYKWKNKRNLFMLAKPFGLMCLWLRQSYCLRQLLNYLKSILPKLAAVGLSSTFFCEW